MTFPARSSVKFSLIQICLLLSQPSLAQSLPDPLRFLGDLKSPLNIIVPNYSEAPLPTSWQSFYLKPSISYDTFSFDGSRFDDVKGISLGASGGYDFSYGDFVFGPAVEVNYSFAEGDVTSIGGVVGFEPSIDVYGTAGGRAGFVWDRTLIYATGGYAFANARLKNDAVGVSESKLLSGWSAGGGGEYLWSDRNSFRLEYKRLEFSDENFDALPGEEDRVKASANKISVGFVQRF